MTPWQIIVANSLLPSGTAYEHIQAQRQNTPVQVYQGKRTASAAKTTVRASLAATVHTAAIQTFTATAQPTTLSTPQTTWKSSP